MAEWVPSQVLVAALGASVALIAWLLRQQFGLLVARLSAIEATLADVDRRLPKLATVEQLGSMGERFDKRIGELRERVGIVEIRVSDIREERRLERAVDSAGSA